MVANFIGYFTNLNSAGQALLIVGILLVITFIILLIVIFKPEKNKVKKVYGENIFTDSENIFEERMKDIDNINDDDINIENDKTRNLKSIVDELKSIEEKNAKAREEMIKQYETDEENTAVISIETLMNSNKPFKIEKRVHREEVKVNDEELLFEEDRVSVLKSPADMEPVVLEEQIEKKYNAPKEIFSSVYTPKGDDSDFLNSLKEFRNNL